MANGSIKCLPRVPSPAPPVSASRRGGVNGSEKGPGAVQQSVSKGIKSGTGGSGGRKGSQMSVRLAGLCACRKIAYLRD